MSPDAWQAWLCHEVTDAFMEMIEQEIVARTERILASVNGKRADEYGLQAAYDSGAINALRDAVNEARDRARRTTT